MPHHLLQISRNCNSWSKAGNLTWFPNRGVYLSYIQRADMVRDSHNISQ
jgi:hypothetical protein